MPLGLREDSTGNATVAWELLLNLVDHDLDLGWIVLQLTDGVRAIGAVIELLLAAASATRPTWQGCGDRHSVRWERAARVPACKAAMIVLDVERSGN